MGRGSALALAAAGWDLAVSGRRADALEETAASVRSVGGEALVLPHDVRTDDPAPLIEQIERKWERLDGLVLAAGLNAPRRTWADQSMSEFEQIVQTDLTGVVRGVDAALPALRRTQGIIVVVSSYAAWTYAPLAGVAYGASKTALGVVVRTLNSQEAEHGVRACHLCPGDVDTDFLRLRPNEVDQAARAVMLTSADVGDAVCFVLTVPDHVRIDELVLSPVSQR